MPDNVERERLLAVARAAAARHRGHLQNLPQISDRPLTPGDVLRLPITAAFDVDWIVLLRKLDQRDGYLMVPADAGNLVGSGDLELAEGSGFGVRVARCSWGRWLPAAALGGASRVDVITGADVGRLLALWSNTQRPDFEGTTLGREEEASPEYEDWIAEVVEPACTALESGASKYDGPHELAAPKQKNPMRWRWTAAAALVAVLAGGYLANLQHAVFGLKGHLATLAEKLTQAEEESFLASPSVAMIILTRSKMEVNLDPKASHLVIALEVQDVDPEARFRVTLRRAGEEPALKVLSDLAPSKEDGVLLFGFPRRLVPPGTYEMHFEVTEGGPYRLYRDDQLVVRFSSGALVGP